MRRERAKEKIEESIRRTGEGEKYRNNERKKQMVEIGKQEKM